VDKCKTLGMGQIIVVQVLYNTLNGINIFLSLLRFLKYCDFQPRLGVVTRTLARAFQAGAYTRSHISST
jgi:hypothetical protein